MFNFLEDALVYTTIAYVLTTIFGLSFLVMYVLGAVRRDKAENPDRFLGARVFLLMMVSMSYQIVLFGLSQMLASALEEDAVSYSTSGERSNQRMDMALGTMLGGFIAAIYPTVLYILVRVRDSRRDPVLRSSLGLNAILTGVVFTILVTALMIDMMLDQGSTDELVAMTFVYLGGSLLCGVPLALAVPAVSRSATPPPPRY
jgi:hypothetical protein